MSFIFARVCEFQEHFSENKGERIDKRTEYTQQNRGSYFKKKITCFKQKIA
jgi:hypothetical protein